MTGTTRVDVFAASRDELAGIDPLGGPSAMGWPCVEATAWAGGLDLLAAALSGRELDEFGDHELVFPNPVTGDWDGPWLVRVPDQVVDALARLDSEQISGYTAAAGITADEAARMVALSHLCRQALGQRELYQWSTE